MEITNLNKTLLSFLLALKDLATPLSDNEQSTFSQAAEQLSANPKAWEVLIEPSLLATIQANESLNQLFQAAKSQVDGLGDNIPLDLLPTEAELEQAAPTPETQPLTRAPLQVSPSDFRSNEITNMAIRVMATPNPSETVKKLSRIEQLQQFLNQRIGGR